jgi:formylglycine-generating enzyme required for sulfatase activity
MSPFSFLLSLTVVALTHTSALLSSVEQFGGAFLPEEPMVAIGAAVYVPVFPKTKAEASVAVKPFRLDRQPVTNAGFLAFVREHPAWRRDRVRAVLAEPGYLAHWADAERVGPIAGLAAPVVRVSWFAARAFCEARGARLPTEVEWELVAAASEGERDGRKDPAWAARILAWYGQLQKGASGQLGRHPPNAYGVEDLHGLIWEWVLDFNSTRMSGDAREGGETERMTFCGAGALAAVDRGDYATFMRVAMRSSLSAAYVTGSLGFRCARDDGATEASQ